MRTYVSLVQLDQVVDETINAMQDGKKEIFDISEKARQDCLTLEEEYILVKRVLDSTITEVDKYEIKEQLCRNKIQTINENFDAFKEEDIKKAYEEIKDVQIQLSLKRKEEKDLFDKRTDLEMRLRDSKEVLQKAETLTTKVSVALEYLTANLFEQLEDMKHQKELGLKIIQAQENEKQRISRDMHDGPAQIMANVVVKAEYCEKLLDIDQKKAKKELRALKELVRDSLKDIRGIIYDLMPMSLEDLGLIPTIHKLIKDLENTSKVKVDFQATENYQDYSPIIKLTVFRIVQESFNNIHKHSKAKKVNLKLDLSSDEIDIYIKDNGVGFNLEAKHLRDDKESGFGLYSIRERIDLLNGQLEVKSELKKGTIIKAKIPLFKEGGE